jgi:hypothetical protein
MLIFAVWLMPQRKCPWLANLGFRPKADTLPDLVEATL